ncbi:hypothetical protein EDB84DRAFT_542659 [Lactarius hengduanensis]|nr:hypothetical protein EDB84DRAFT_542659 [Lactarius hengduanensis]
MSFDFCHRRGTNFDQPHSPVLGPGTRIRAVDWAQLRRGGAVCSSFRPGAVDSSLLRSCAAFDFLGTSSSGTGKSWWARVAGFPCKYHAVALTSSRRSSAGRFGGACVIVVSLAVSQPPIFKLQGASPSSLLARCLSLCSVFSVLCMLMSLCCVCACVLIRVLYSFACIL